MTVFERRERYNWYCNGGYSFEVPATPDEIKEEGRIMHYALCTGMWNDKHMNGELTVVFFKQDGQSYIDMLVVDNIFVHAVRKDNAEIDDDDLINIEKWANKSGITISGDKKALQCYC